jgi:phage/conjugal plasmid C-4 type zinc finger TraR family protein
MADAIDRATELAEREREAIVARSVAAGQGAPSGRLWCEECDALIPQQRRVCVPQTRVCVDCASAAEARGRRYAR